MIPKQDRSNVRTPEGIERKYNLRKTAETAEAAKKAVSSTGVLTSADGTISINLANNTISAKGQDGNSIELSAGNVLARDNNGNVRIRMGKIAGGNYLLSLLPASGNGLSFVIFEDSITFSAHAYGSTSNESHELAWKNNGDGTYSLIGI